MNITLTTDVRNANAITHGGIFHADEVFGTIILSKVMDNIVLAEDDGAGGYRRRCYRLRHRRR